MITTIEEAQQALQEAEMDVAADFGEAMVDQAWSDIVHSTASMCSDEVASELLRRNGLSMEVL